MSLISRPDILHQNTRKRKGSTSLLKHFPEHSSLSKTKWKGQKMQERKQSTLHIQQLSSFRSLSMSMKDLPFSGQGELNQFLFVQLFCILGCYFCTSLPIRQIKINDGIETTALKYDLLEFFTRCFI
jgi:hypothetical protein